MIYSERQVMDQWWLRLILLIGPATVIYSLGVHARDADIDLRSSEDLMLLGVCLFTFLVTAVLWRMTLRTEVDDREIHLRFWPFARKVLPISEIQEADAVTYNALSDYGGWGVRWSANGRAWNAKGNEGVKLKMKNGKSILIGSQKAELLKDHIVSAMQRVAVR